MNVAQPALGLQIRQLEADLGVELLARHARGVTPTKAGSRLYERARSILKSIEEARRESVAFRGAEPVRLGLTPSLMRAIGPAIQSQVDIAVPSVDVRIIEAVSASLIEMLKSRDIDLALVYHVEDQRRVSRVHLCDEELYFISRRSRSSGKGPITLAQVLDHSLAIQTDRSAIFQTVVDAARAISKTPNVTFTARSTEGIVSIAAHGLAAGILPASTVARALPDGLIAARRIERPRLHRALFLVRRAGEKRSATDDKVDNFLRALFRENSRDWFGSSALRRR